MHVIFQFPITDLRPLNADKNLRLLRPLWSSPDIEEGRPFIRQFGRLKNRTLGGVTGWPAEEHYCDARLSIKYQDIHKQGFDIGDDETTTINKVYRRLYSDGKFMNKIELGFVDDLENRLKHGRHNRWIKLENVLKHYCNLPIQIDKKSIQLSKAAPLLCSKFAKATTVKDKYTEEITQAIISGQLNVTVVLSSMDNLELPSHANLISEFKAGRKTISLYGCKIRLDDKNVKVWIIKAFKNTDILPKDAPLKVVVRNLRINLARIHAERETLRILLSNIMTGEVPVEKGSAEAKVVKGYVKKVAKKLFAKERNKLDQENILNFALASEELALPGSLESLNDTAISFADKYTTKVIGKMAEKLEETQVKTVLILSSNPRGKQALNVQNELDVIMNKHESGKFRDFYKVVYEPSVESKELIRFLFKYQPHILHISLHASRVDGLYFETANREPAAISIKQFKEIVETYTKYHLLDAVVLSACNTLGHAEAVRSDCSYVIGTNTAIPDEASSLYSEYFYETLFDLDTPNIRACHDVAIVQLQQSNLQSSGDKPIHAMFDLLNKQ